MAGDTVLLHQRSDIPLKPDRPYALVRPYLEPGYQQWSDDLVVTGRMLSRANLEMPSPVSVMMAAPAPPPPPAAEQLGDLKLYRVPQRTTIAANQMKQTRLVEQRGVPFERIHTASVSPANYGSGEERPGVLILLRTKNDKQSNLGLPLPSGAFVIQQVQLGRSMRISEPTLRDTAEDEKIELGAGISPDVTVIRRTLKREGNRHWVEVEITNASPQAITFELKVPGYGNWKIAESDVLWIKRDGTPVFVVPLASGGSRTLRFTSSGN